MRIIPKNSRPIKGKRKTNQTTSLTADLDLPTISTLNMPLQLNELQHFLNKCSNTSPEPDGISNILLINLLQEVLNYMLSIFILGIWNQNICPTRWQKAIVVPILKVGKIPTNPNSYRPTALTNTMCKLMEKIINYRPRWFLETKQLISKFQSGFRQSIPHTTI